MLTTTPPCMTHHFSELMSVKKEACQACNPTAAASLQSLQDRGAGMVQAAYAAFVFVRHHRSSGDEHADAGSLMINRARRGRCPPPTAEDESLESPSSRDTISARGSLRVSE